MPSSPQLTSARILIAADAPSDAEHLHNLLTGYGYRHVERLDTHRHLHALYAQPRPDLILLDIALSELSRIKLLATLRNHWGEPTPAVVIVTSGATREIRIKALHLGIHDLIAKPLDPPEIIHRLRNILEIHILLRERLDRATLLQHLVAERTETLQRLALEDPVTALPNRPALLQHLNNLLRQNETTAIYFIALEGLDDIVHLHGLNIGETLALQLRDRLLEHFPWRATLGIWNTSEWLMITRQPLSTNITAQSHKLLHCIAQPLSTEQVQTRLSARIGISHTGILHDSAEHLVRQAALALPDNIGGRLYETSLETALHKRIQLRQALRLAAERNELSLVYQPQVELRSGRVVGAEALLRWRHPQLGPISPSEFIPLAEESGDILRIGEWVIDSAIRQLEQWFDADLLPGDFSLAVNVAPLQLTQSDFARNLLARLELSSLPQGALEIEITESGLMRNVDLAREQLQQLARAHVPVAIDDFGTGHSSLANLKTLPVSVLKIDRAFVSGMHSDPQDLRLVETVIDMARNFRCHTVAEGVERREQADLLLALGCQIAQGYLYSPPLKAERFLDYCLTPRVAALS